MDCVHEGCGHTEGGYMKARIAVAAAAVALLAVSCGSKKETAESTTTAAATETTAAATETTAAATETTAAATETTAAASSDQWGTAMEPGASGCIVSGTAAATGEPIKVGSIQSKTGPDDFSSSGQGAKAFFECVNANGGINGRPVEFLLEDDQWTPDVAAQAAAKLINDEGVVAMVGNSSFVECGVNAALYEEKGIVAVYGTGVPKECFFVKNMSATNSGPRISAIGAAQSLKDQFDVKSLVCIAGNIPSTGGWVCPGVEDWGKAAGVEVRTILHDPAAPDFTAIVQDAMSGNPDGILLMEPAGLAVPFLKVAEEQDLREKAHWAGPTSLYLATFPATIGAYWNGFLTVQAELTTIDAATPDNQAWLATMEKYGSADDPRDTFSQAGWLAAKIFTQTLLQLSGDITRENVTAAIKAVKNYRSDLMCTPWYFGEGDRHNANHAGRVMIINKDGAYEKIQDCAEVPDPEVADVLQFEKDNGLVG